MADDYLLGMDIGTTNIKAIIIDAKGRILAKASRKLSLIMPAPQYVEQDADEWWSSAVQIFQELRSKTGSAVMDNIRGICVSSQTVTLLPVDREGRPLRNAIIWMDNRADREVEYLTEQIGLERYMHIIGTGPSGTFLAGKLLWFRINEPELFDRTYRILQASSYVNYKLTGEMTMDISQASMTQCLDRNTVKWSDTVGMAMGVDLNTLLPQPLPCGKIIGSVTKIAAAETGLKEGIPVMAGASDCQTSMYATGITKVGEAGESSGTSSMLFVGSSVQSRPECAVSTKPCDIKGMPYIFDAPLSSTGASIEWFLNTIGKEYEILAAKQGISRYDYLNLAAGNVPAGAGGVFFHPYLQGERAPLWNSHARGMFIGMTLNTTTDDMARAVLEGTAFALRHVAEVIANEGAGIESLRITGGGAKSRTWSRIKASMLNVPVMITDERCGEVPFGDALIAGRSAGIFPDLKASINELVSIREVVEPDPEWARYYDDSFPYFKELYSVLDQPLKELQRIQSDLLHL